MKNTDSRWVGFKKGDYNHPPDGWIEVSESVFSSVFFSYIAGKNEFRQLYLKVPHHYTDPIFDAHLFWFYNEPLGVALVRFPNSRVGFFKFGTDESWKDFTREFCNQFAGDNS